MCTTIGRPTSKPDNPEYFKHVMHSAGYTIYKLAKELHVAYSTVHNWCTGAAPSTAHLNKLVPIFGLQAMRPYLKQIDTTTPDWERYRNIVAFHYADYYTAPKSLRLARQEANLNQAACADIFHVTRKTWNDWESGRTTPSYANRILLEDAFGPLFYGVRPGIYQPGYDVIPYFDDEPESLTYNDFAEF